MTELLTSMVQDRKQRSVGVKIEGKVQGVCYRAWTAETAAKLGLDGTVRNCPDGSVEAVFSGPSGEVEKMLLLCLKGPPAARVRSVSIVSQGMSVEPGFRVLGSDWR